MSFQFKIIIKVLILITLVCDYIKCANILYLEGVPSASHHIWNRALMQGLVESGHNLTVLTVEIEDSTPNLHFIVMENVYEILSEQRNDAITASGGGDSGIDFTEKSEFRVIKEMYDFYIATSKVLLKTNGIQILLNYPDTFHFDLIIHDFTSAQSLLGFVHKFNYPPLVSVTPFGIPSYLWSVTYAPINPSFVPFFVSPTLDKRMNFVERIKNTIFYSFDWIYRQVFYMAIENFGARKVFGLDLPKLEQIERNASLVLLNCDWSLDYPLLLSPNVIPVGGLHLPTTLNDQQTTGNELDFVSILI